MDSNHIPDLPQELVDTFIDYIHDQQAQSSSDDNGVPVPTLKSCALVCKAWLPRARKHLFHTLYIGRNLIASSRQNARKKGVQNSKCLGSLLSDPSCLPPQICSLVRKLVIRNYVLITSITTEYDNGFGRLPFTSLQEIELHNNRYAQRIKIDTRSFAELVKKNSQTLEALRLIGLQFRSGREFTDVFKALRDPVQHSKRFRSLEIRSLGISNVSDHVDEPSQGVVNPLDTPTDGHSEETIAAPLELRVLKYCYSSSYTTFFLQSPTSEPLFHLTSLQELVLLNPDTLDHLRILEPCKNSLVKLVLSATAFLQSSFPPILATHLSSLTCLRNLELQGLSLGSETEVSFINVVASALLDFSAPPVHDNLPGGDSGSGSGSSSQEGEDHSASNDNDLCLTLRFLPVLSLLGVQWYGEQARVLDDTLSGLVRAYGIGPPEPETVASSSMLELGSANDSPRTVGPKSLWQENNPIRRHRHLKRIWIIVSRETCDVNMGVVEALFPRLKEVGVGCGSNRGPGVLVTFELEKLEF
ncbi:hypothetical protein K435DRAFT_837445 [Dendrothele bispora CBS 962.96]|uniref:Uncharacterized protein n=1 Tax=Dendrothele bispora (strain CBS 962.96) TaxID=1314807 RepID=A0A4S8MCW6_DENBC|nr:hypothetical protein K435DRAFT_837445 [Dendrothele bispora CBS 962.96]